MRGALIEVARVFNAMTQATTSTDRGQEFGKFVSSESTIKLTLPDNKEIARRITTIEGDLQREATED